MKNVLCNFGLLISRLAFDATGVNWIKAVSIAGLFMAQCVFLRGQIVSFNFTGTSPGLNAPWATTSTLDPHLTITTGWSLGSVTGNAANNRFTATAWSQGADFGSASTGNDYVYFVISPSSGYTLNLSAATINFSLQNSGTGPDFYSVRSNFDSYATNLSAGSSALNSAGGTTVTSLTLPTSITLSALTSSVEFRVYGWGATATGGTFSVNNWSMTGSVDLAAVPEPSTYAAFFGGIVLGCAAILRRRRTRKSAPVASN